MTIETNARRTALFNGDGTTTVFHFAFKVFNANEADVVVTSALTGTHSLTFDVDFTVTLNADQDTNPGGYITLSDPLASVFTLQIKSAVPYTQLVKLNNAGGFYPEVMNLAFDKLTMLVQQLLDTQENPEVFGNLYSWRAYANSADGTVDFTNGAWDGHTYRGEAYNKLTAHESTDPADYVWEQIGFDGAPGVNGTKAVTLTAFKWSNSGAGSHAQAFVYTWASGAVSAYPAGWSASAPSSPDTGYTLHMIHVTVTDDAEAVTSSGNWSSALESTIGYREDGSIGIQGQGQLQAFSFLRATSAPSTPTGGSYASPTASGWSDGIPAGTDPVYVVKRLFTSDALPPQESAWSTPAVFAINGDDGVNAQGAKIRRIFSAAGSAPSLPAASDTTGWDTVADTNTIWYSEQINTTDHTGAVTSYGAWQSPPYRIKGETGSSGTDGQSYRRAYVVTTLATPPSITAGSGDVVPTNTPSGQVSGKGWSFNAYSSLAAGEFQYVTDGIYTTGGNIAWGSAYLNYLKVGSLSALSADLGVVEISSVGSLASTGKAYGNSTAGFYLGYSGGAHKLDIGDSAKNLRWDGSNLAINGDIVETANIKSNAVTLIRSARNSGTFWQTFSTIDTFYTVTGSELTFPADANRGVNNILLLSWWPENRPSNDEEWVVSTQYSTDGTSWTDTGDTWYFKTPQCSAGHQDLTTIWDFLTYIPTTLFYMRLKAKNVDANNARIKGYNFMFVEYKR